MMTRRAFRDLLRLHGPALDAWPKPLDQEARNLLARSRLARRRYSAVLVAEDASGPPDPIALVRMQAGLRRRLASLDARLPAASVPPSPSLRYGMVAACFAAGLWFGITAVTPERTAPADILPDLHVSPALADVL